MEYLVMLPGPTNVPGRVMNAMLSPIINHRSDDFRSLYKDVVDKTQRVFQTSNDVVVLTASGTGAVEASVVNLVKKGDNIVIPVNGEFGGRLADLIENWGGNSIRINSKFGENPPLEQIEDAFEANKNIKALYAVYNETSTGTTLRYLEKLGELCSKHGSLFIVDAVSVLGGDELPVDKWGIDVCMTASQKALAAPPGVAPISISAKAKKTDDRKPSADSILQLEEIL
jgi:aspartate aminotransferase-like enzyme